MPSSPPSTRTVQRHGGLAIPPPTLKTLEAKPSWINRAGRVDRSACIEVRASEIWPWIEPEQWRIHRTFVAAPRNDDDDSCDQRGVGRPFREASAEFTLGARHLASLHDRRVPLQLAGDYRTRKSNAMRSPMRAEHLPFALNPNRGATRIKTLAVWLGHEPFYRFRHSTRDGWRQTLRVERWRLHERLAQHFLICPRCRRKHLKLLMVLAGKDEAADAQFAEGWLAMVDAQRGLHGVAGVPGTLRSDPRLNELRARVIDRYGLLFHDRQLVCRRCLGVRYGEVKWDRDGGAHDRALREAQAKAARRAAQDAQAQAQRDAEQREMLAALRPLFERASALHDGRGAASGVDRAP